MWNFRVRALDFLGFKSFRVWFTDSGLGLRVRKSKGFRYHWSPGGDLFFECSYAKISSTFTFCLLRPGSCRWSSLIETFVRCPCFTLKGVLLGRHLRLRYLCAVFVQSQSTKGSDISVCAAWVHLLVRGTCCAPGGGQILLIYMYVLHMYFFL